MKEREREIRRFRVELARLLAAEAACTACAAEAKRAAGTLRPAVCLVHRELRNMVAGFR